MFTYNIELYEQKSWQPLKGWIRPFTDGETLDESLDSGRINLSMVRRGAPIKPFTRLRITVFENGKQVDIIDRLVINDRVILKRFKPFRLYDHDIDIIELTKQLEREVCDTMTVTNYLGHEYDSVPQTEIFCDYNDEGHNLAEMGIIKGDDLTFWTDTSSVGYFAKVEIFYVYNNYRLYTPYQTGTTITTPIIRWTYTPTLSTTRIFDLRVTVIKPDNTEVDLGYLRRNPPFETYQFNVDKSGKWILRFYAGTLSGSGSNPTWTEQGSYFEMEIAVTESLAPSAPWTITGVVNRLLSAGVTRRKGIDPQKYVFDSEQAAKYEKVIAPEFYFTRGTMFEALLTVGSYIYGIPRLVDKDGQLTLRFDELTSDNIYSGKLPPCVYEDSVLLGDEYCGSIDSPADNLVNTTDKKQGAVTEPSVDSYRAMNCTEGGLKISTDTMVFLYDQPLNQSVRLIAMLADNRKFDLTPFLYEESEYNLLSDYATAPYPYSKSYALCYRIGGTEITGFNFTAEDISTGTFAKNYAIVNILNQLGAGIDNDYDFVNGLTLSFSYISNTNSRLVQRRPYLTHPTDNALIFNQGGNMVESEYYGERMKGTLARIGLTTTRRTYEFSHYDDIPKCGQRIGSDYVVNVDKEYDTVCIKATITTTPTFKKLAEYLGVKSNVRMYDISERQSVERNVHYDETVLISHSLKECGNPMITQTGLLVYMLTFSSQNITPVVSACTIKSMSGINPDAVNEKNTDIGITAGKLAVGNSMCFYAFMKNNYGAGYQSSKYMVSQNTVRAQRQVRYCDQVGNLSTAEIAFGYTFENTQDFSFDYPEGGELSGTYFDTGKYPLIIAKDNREQLRYFYQLHHQADNFNIIIGSALCQNNVMINAGKKTGIVVFIKKPINSLDNIIDLSSEDVIISDVVLSVTSAANSVFKIEAITNNTAETIFAWAFVQKDTGEIYIGENYPNGLAPNASANELYFNFMDNAHLAECEME